MLGEKRNDTWIYEDKQENDKEFKNRLKQWIYICRSLWIAGRHDSTLFGVVDDTTTTKFTGRAYAVHCNSRPVVVVILKFLLPGQIRHFRNEKVAGAEMRPSIVFGIVTEDVPVGYWRP